MLLLNASVTRAPVESVLSCNEPSKVIDTILPLVNLTFIVVFTSSGLLELLRSMVVTLY